METQTIRRQYDEVIAAHYDSDPQNVTARSLERAMLQLKRHLPLTGSRDPIKVFDVGLGTGMFLSTLQSIGAGRVVPFGLDLSQKMIELACERVPDLTAAVDDAANLDQHFTGESFDLICTHFMTGFVPISVLAPKIHARLEQGGFWSLVGGTKAGFPKLRGAVDNKLLKMLFGGKDLPVREMTCNPEDRADVVQTLEANGFAVREEDTFRPTVHFKDFDDFMTFAYRGGWLTPFVESLGLHEANAMTRSMLNLMFFPKDDNHVIEIVLAQKI